MAIYAQLRSELMSLQNL